MVDSKSYFTRVASEWDELRAGYFDESVILKALDHVKPTSAMTVLDLGTGTGFVAIALSKLAGRVIGIDTSPDMLRVAKSNVEKTGIRNVDFIAAAGELLPVESGAIDVVYGNMVLHHIPDPAAAFAEISRVLKQGGSVVLTDLDKHSYEWFRETMADYWLGFDRNQVRDWMRTAGFSNVHVDCADTECSTKAPSSSLEVNVSVFYAHGRKK